MSGLEPLAALGLACNILQVIGVGRETVRIARQVYKDGSLDPALEEKAGILDDVASQIRRTTTMTTTATTTRSKPKKPSAHEKRLLDLAEKCQGAARDLQEEVAFLNGPPDRTRLVATLKIAAKTNWRKRRLEALDRKLQDAEKLLQTGLLTSVYERTEKINIDLLSLDQDLRSFVEEYRKGHTTTTKLVSTEAVRTRQHLTAETKKSEDAVKGHITRETRQLEASLRQHMGVAMSSASQREAVVQVEAKRERLIQSLKFDRINERRNQVVHSHPDTFQWVLQDGSEMYKPTVSWDSFSDWLRSTETVYWISGKPGSGKSTMMKFLLGHKKTLEYLHLWNSETFMVSHFFWRPGSRLQQSIKGMLCSLLYQLLLQDLESADAILNETCEAARKDSDTDWSEAELEKTLQSVIRYYPRPICMFLDGLDEVLPEDGVLQLLEKIDFLRQSFGGRLKICLGSRREPLIERRLGMYPQLRLGDLNHADLFRYARDRIIVPSDYEIIVSSTENWEFEYITSTTSVQIWLVEKLVSKAEGVFLWLCLTTKEISVAVENGETIKDLKNRIDSLPGEIGRLYANMWERANNDSEPLKRRAAIYLLAALAQERSLPAQYLKRPLPTFNKSTPFAMMTMARPEIRASLLQRHPEDVPAESIIKACQATTRDVRVRCAGILEGGTVAFPKPQHEVMIPWHGEEYNALVPYVASESAESAFRFIHRTARDFLVDTCEGREILGAARTSLEKIDVDLFETRLAACQLFYWPVLIKLSKGEGGLCMRQYHSELFGVEKDLERLYKDTHDPRQRADLYRLFLLCEQLFNSGRLFSLTDELQGPDPTNHKTSHTTVAVHRKHEFLLETARNQWHFWEILQATVIARKLDYETKSQILMSSCPELEPGPLTAAQYELARTLLDSGASPSWKGRSLHSHFYTESPPHCQIRLVETPFSRILYSTWEILRESYTASSQVDSSDLRIRLDFIVLLLARGANLREEIFFSVFFPIDNAGEIITDSLLRMLIRTSLDRLSYQLGVIGESMFVLLAYPASALLTAICQDKRVHTILGDGGVGRLLNQITADGGSRRRLVAIGEAEQVSGTRTLWDRESYAIEAGLDLEDSLFPLGKFADQALGKWSSKMSIAADHPDVRAGITRILERQKAETAQQKERLGALLLRTGLMVAESQ